MLIMKEKVPCPCGGVYLLVPDEEITEIPPDFTSKPFHCNTCGYNEWLTPDSFDLDSWDEVEEKYDLRGHRS